MRLWRRNDSEPTFNPLGPVGPQAEDVRPADFDPAAEGPADERLTRLIDQATRPPAELTLDWARLQAGLSAEREVAEAARRASRAVAVRRGWLRTAYRAGGLAAVAAAVVLATVLAVRFAQRPAVTPQPPVGPTALSETSAIGSRMASAVNRLGQRLGQIASMDLSNLPAMAAMPVGPAEPVVRVGLEAAAARALIEQPAEGPRAEIRVVFPRRREGRLPVRPVAAASGPIVLTGSATMSGTPYVQPGWQMEPDNALFNF